MESPTIQKLIQWNVPTLIGGNFVLFCLANRVMRLELSDMEHSKNTERINFAILTRRLEGQGLKPTSWKTAIKEIHM